MSATSVTGTGPGSADGQNRGSEHQTLGTSHLIGPRVVAAGTTTLDVDGAASVPVTAAINEIPPIGYIAIVNDITDASSAFGVINLVDPDVYINILGTPFNDVNWVLIKAGL